MSLYHNTPQQVGRIRHEAIDKKTYSSSKHILQGIDVYSEELSLSGKIDIYDTESEHLIERKTKITKIYDGYLMQLYAQYFCLVDMGYKPKSLSIYSIDDNKRYPINLPNKQNKDDLLYLIDKIRQFKPEQNYNSFVRNNNKCDNCIYSEMCR